MNFQDMQSLVLWRLRQRGVNFGGAPSNAPTDYDPPYVVALLLNQGYAEFLSRTKDYPIAALKVGFLTTLNATAYALNPIPANGGTLNPAALCVYEATYTYNTGEMLAQEYRIPILSTQRFRWLAGAYVRRISDFGPRVLAASQLFGKPQLDVLPATATIGDLIQLTVCPDIYNGPANLTCASGGLMSQPTDVPLFPAQFHMAIVDYAVAKAAPAADKQYAEQSSMKSFEAYITSAMEYGSARGEGDPEQRVSDVWEGATDPAYILGA